MGPKFNRAGVLIKRGIFGLTDRHTGIMPCDNRGRDWSDVAARNAKTCQEPQKLEEAEGILPYSFHRECGPAHA